MTTRRTILKRLLTLAASLAFPLTNLARRHWPFEEVDWMYIGDHDPYGEDMARDIKFAKLRERYGIMVLEEGAGIVKAKNIKTDTRAYDFDDALMWDAATGALPTGWTGL